MPPDMPSMNSSMDHSMTPAMNTSMTPSMNPSMDPSVDRLMNPPTNPSMNLPMDHGSTDPYQLSTEPMIISQQAPNHVSVPTNDHDGGFLHDFLQSIIGGDPFPREIAPGEHVSGTWTPRNVFDFGANTDLELNDLDLNFLDGYNHEIPFTSFVETPETNRSVPGSASEPPSALGVESLQKSSTWRFRPVTQDRGMGDQQNISLPSGETSKRLPVQRRVTSEMLSYTMRDRIMALFMSSSNEETLQKTMQSFPSLELLDSLLQYFLSSKTAISNRMMHLPTFRPNNARPELIAAMVVGGATLAPDVSLRKMGFALMEVIRVGVPQNIERDNTLIGDIECVTSLCIGLSAGLWSGNSRKMEIAESFLQPYLTMCRRRGWFRRSAYETIVPYPTDVGKALEDKWHAWAKQEMRKRLVFYLLEYDTRQSIALFTNPLISYAELGLPLPEAESLWLAATAEKWKQTYLNLNQHKQREPSLTDLLQDVELLGEGHDMFDETTASQALLGAAWRLIWEYRQMCSISRGHASSWSNSKLLLSSRLTELTKLLDCVKMSSHTNTAMTLSLELLHMHLHISLEEMHLFAGAEGHSEARRVYPLLQDWAKSSSARQGVYHAAQIVAAARKIPTGCLRDFHAIVLYQAGLALWSYGVISNSALTESALDSMSNTSSVRRGESIVMLDEADNGAQRFINLNKGQAAIKKAVGDPSASHVLLSDPAAVMGVLMDVFRMNGRPSRSAPPLVENLLELMEGLRLAVMEPSSS
ncbi:uncharacterized protein M437DRAFT_80055 [Aureobasidium melanogenum CBS 110374]|uniref:Xylanolytic transcriptional activator regulatory domain-containing protein n=1 Tax=Aureobasidium melanogenum (strain CBS 110374) TaxID=1043003 RepID=A0A074W754_AURM1|nr:uncharacterized protein M437DRAFT_80055 [Aureobasidium melanogenum CBS 110374]KEQ67409.1 hypothetical protein M437DRAFT_80055 [Aureobasidium melanogenum CBS 110374]